MEWLNYHHLLYFWTVVKEGGIAPAAAKLRLAPSTVSAQLTALQSSLGEKLFNRPGRRLELTEMGRIVYRYADEIFRLGHEMIDTVHDRPTGKPLMFTVGIVDVVPKHLVKRLLEPIRHVKTEVRLTCREGRPEKLLPELAIHILDMLVVDAPVPPSTGVHVFNHLLIECGTSLLATPRIAKQYKRSSLKSLDGAPFLLTTSNTAQRRGLDEWFAERNIRPQVVAESEDSTLLEEFGQDGQGIFGVPSYIEKSICRQLGVQLIIRLPQVQERFYAVTAERRVSHPAIAAILDVFHQNR